MRQGVGTSFSRHLALEASLRDSRPAHVAGAPRALAHSRATGRPGQPPVRQPLANAHSQLFVGAVGTHDHRKANAVPRANRPRFVPREGTTSPEPVKITLQTLLSDLFRSWCRITSTGRPMRGHSTRLWSAVRTHSETRRREYRGTARRMLPLTTHKAKGEPLMIRAGLLVGLAGLSLVALGCERSDTAGERAPRTGSPAAAAPPAHPAVPGRTEPCPGGPGGLNAAGYPCEPPTAKGRK